jgi:colicin import membrane protein
MSTALKSSPEERPEVDPFRYGWRYAWQSGPNGQQMPVRVPLTQADVLHPQEDDFIVQNEDHVEDCHFLRTILSTHLANRPGIHVLHDHRIDWRVEGVGAHGPDFAVIEGFPTNWDRTRGTFSLAEFNAQVVLVLEVTSPTTRDQDLDDKVDEYYQAGVPFYAIVDRLFHGGEQPRLLAYRAVEKGYERLKADAQGWLSLEPIGLFLAFEGDKLVCRNTQGQRLLDYQEVVQAYREAESRAQAEAQARQQAEVRAAAAEERNRHLEAELNRLRGQS